ARAKEVLATAGAERLRAIREFDAAEQAPTEIAARPSRELQCQRGIGASVCGDLGGVQPVPAGAELQFEVVSKAEAQRAVCGVGGSTVGVAPVGCTLFQRDVA